MQEGEFSGIVIGPSIKPYLIEKDLWVELGDKVYPFSAANYSIGTFVFNFDTREQVENLITNRHKLIKINVI